MFIYLNFKLFASLKISNSSFAEPRAYSKGIEPIVDNLKQEPKEYNFIDHISLVSSAAPVDTAPPYLNYNVDPNFGVPDDRCYNFSAISDVLKW